MKPDAAKSELKYQQLARERQRAALRGRSWSEASKTLSRNGARLMKWRKVDRKYAARQLGWALDAIRQNCK